MSFCPYCELDGTHEPDCELLRELRKQGLIPEKKEPFDDWVPPWRRNTKEDKQ